MSQLYRYLFAALALLLVCVGLSRPVGTARGQQEDPTPTPNIQATVSPLSGRPGDEFTFQISGLGRRAYFSHWFSGPDGTIIESQGVRLRADEHGNASWTWRAPLNAAVGPWLMVFQTDQYSPPRNVRFEITSQAPPDDADTAPSYQPGGVVKPSAGPPGTIFLFASDGFGASEPIRYSLIDPYGNLHSREHFRGQADALGRVFAAWVAPQGAAVGVWQIVLLGSDTTFERTIRFEVRGA